MIQYRPQFLEALYDNSISNVPFTIIVSTLVAATLLYFAATFALIIPWARVYRGMSIRRPSALLYAALLLFALYVCAVLSQKFAPLYLMLEFMGTVVSHEIYTAYFHWSVGGIIALIEEYPYYFAAITAVIVDFFYRIKERKEVRDQALGGRPLTFRGYYNY
jgi:hypothetical protein